MSLAPRYGDTPLPFEEIDALLPSVRDVLDEPIRKADVYAIEQAIQEEVTEDLLTEVIDGTLGVDDLLSADFAIGVHQRLYGEVWIWAGAYRRYLLNIGVDPEQVQVQLRESFATLQYRWNIARNISARELGIAAHAELVRVHPFVDGNGRASRLLGDLVFIAAQGGVQVEMYDWDLDKKRYIALLREYDAHRDVSALAEFVAVRPLDDPA